MFPGSSIQTARPKAYTAPTPMSRITAYILRQVLTTAAYVLITLTLAIWLTQSLRFIDLIVNRGLSLGGYFYLTLLLMPNFLALVTPIALFVATLFVYNRLTGDSELVVMRAVGYGPGQLARPALLLAAGASALSYVLHLWVMPIGFSQFKELQADIRSDYSGLLLQEGAFTRVGQNLTVYVRERETTGDLRGIIVHDTRDAANPVTLLAERGTLAATEDGPRVILLNGNRQQVDRAAGKLSLLYFERYSVEIGQAGAAREFRWREPGERFLHELFWPDMDSSNDRFFIKRLIAEGHTRLSGPLYAFALVIAGLALLLPGDFNRRGMGKRVLAAALAGVTLQALSIAAPNFAARVPAAIPFLYAIPLSAIALSAWALVQGPRRARAREPVAA
jgi:lipopolysaccharide export system permease protein